MGGTFTKSVSPQNRPEVDCITYTVRPAVREDIPTILRMIQLLAEHDGHYNVRKITEQDLLRDGFGDEKCFHCHVAELDADEAVTSVTTLADRRRLVGFVFYYYGYCTWEGRVAYMEDLFVESQFRKRGIGLALLRACAQAAVSDRCVKVHFDAEVSNHAAMKWYKKLGAVEVDRNLRHFEFSGSSLDKLVAGDRSLGNRL